MGAAFARALGLWRRTGYAGYVALALALGLGLRFETFQGTLLADDFDHYAMRAGIYPVERGALDAFDFVSGSAEERAVLDASGRLPWWAAPQLQLAVWRPFASALIAVDHGLLGGRPVLLHAHSMLWWALLVAAVALLLRTVLPLPIAALAVALYALDEAHGLPSGWIANRSALCAVGFVVLGLYFHARERVAGAPRHAAALSMPCIALGLACGEHALAPLAYLVAFELAFMQDAPLRRVRALAPAALLTCAYLGAHHLLGYGLSGSGFYIDPLVAPGRYLEAAAQRLPLLLGDALFGLAAEWHYGGVPFREALEDVVPRDWLEPAALQAFQHALGVCAAVIAIAALYALYRGALARIAHARTARFLLLGALLSLAPLAATLPMSRLLLAPAIGFDALIAWLIWEAGTRAAGTAGAPRNPATRDRVRLGLAALALLALHAGWAGKRARSDAAYYAVRSTLEENWVADARIDDRRVAQQHVFVIAAQDWATQWALPSVRHRHGKPRPKSSHLLSAAFLRPHTLYRPADRLLDVMIEGESVRGTFLGSVYRAEDLPFAVGDFFSFPEFQVLVQATQAGEPLRMRFRFPRSVDDPSYLFLYPSPEGLRRVYPPLIGTRFELPSPTPPLTREQVRKNRAKAARRGALR